MAMEGGVCVLSCVLAASAEVASHWVGECHQGKNFQWQGVQALGKLEIVLSLCSVSLLSLSSVLVVRGGPVCLSSLGAGTNQCAGPHVSLGSF